MLTGLQDLLDFFRLILLILFILSKNSWRYEVARYYLPAALDQAVVEDAEVHAVEAFIEPPAPAQGI